jgi:NAD(P)-dependent dehydrogenase (short-subunit alcohol dehydrogenase family)
MACSFAKLALMTLAKNNAAKLAPLGIRVNDVKMGWCCADNEDALQMSQSDAQWID